MSTTHRRLDRPITERQGLHAQRTGRVAAGVFNPASCGARVPGRAAQARPARPAAQPGHVRGLGRARCWSRCSRSCEPSVFAWLIAVWLWFTVLFANLAEAVAEGRGKAQAESLRAHQEATPWPAGCGADGAEEPVRRRRAADRRPGRRRGRRDDPGRRRRRRGHRHRRRVGDHRRVRAGDPGVRAATGPSVTGGTTVLSDRIVVRDHHQARRVVRGPDDRAGRGRGAAEDAERDRADHPAGRADDHLPARRGRAAADGRLRRQSAVGDRADRAAGLPDPDHDRRAAVGDRHRRHGPAGAAQRARHVRAGPSRPPATSTPCCWTRPAPSPSATGRPPS